MKVRRDGSPCKSGIGSTGHYGHRCCLIHDLGVEASQIHQRKWGSSTRPERISAKALVASSSCQGSRRCRREDVASLSCITTYGSSPVCGSSCHRPRRLRERASPRTRLLLSSSLIVGHGIVEGGLYGHDVVLVAATSRMSVATLVGVGLCRFVRLMT